MPTFVVVYASRAYHGLPDPDACGRCRKAVLVANQNNASIVLGVGMSNPEPLREAMKRYLVDHLGFPTERIISNPVGAGTIGESAAALDAIQENGDGTIIAVSAWYHIIRVWLIWAVALKRFVRVGISWKTYPWTNPLRELIMFPRTLYKILRAARS